MKNTKCSRKNIHMNNLERTKRSTSNGNGFNGKGFVERIVAYCVKQRMPVRYSLKIRTHLDRRMVPCSVTQSQYSSDLITILAPVLLI